MESTAQSNACPSICTMDYFWYYLFFPFTSNPLQINTICMIQWKGNTRKTRRHKHWGPTFLDLYPRDITLSCHVAVKCSQRSPVLPGSHCREITCGLWTHILYVPHLSITVLGSLWMGTKIKKRTFSHTGIWRCPRLKNARQHRWNRVMGLTLEKDCRCPHPSSFSPLKCSSHSLVGMMVTWKTKKKLKYSLSILFDKARALLMHW